jgi:hypothetical protein
MDIGYIYASGKVVKESFVYRIDMSVVWMKETRILLSGHVCEPPVSLGRRMLVLECYCAFVSPQLVSSLYGT